MDQINVGLVMKRKKVRNNLAMTLIAGFIIGFVLGSIYFSNIRLANPRFAFEIISPSQELYRKLNSSEINYQVTNIGNESVRLFCFVMIPFIIYNQAGPIKATWGRRCQSLVFGSSTENKTLPSILLRGQDKWQRTKEILKYVYQNQLSWSNWVLVSDHNTYVVVENLKYLLSQHNYSEAIYFRARIRKVNKNDGVVVLSKSAVVRFVDGINNGSCERVDQSLIECLSILRIKHARSKDNLGRERIFQFEPKHVLIPGEWKPNYLFYTYENLPAPKGLTCCSDTAIAFHHVDPKTMYLMDYFIYYFQPYGLNNSF